MSLRRRDKGTNPLFLGCVVVHSRPDYDTFLAFFKHIGDALGDHSSQFVRGTCGDCNDVVARGLQHYAWSLSGVGDRYGLFSK